MSTADAIREETPSGEARDERTQPARSRGPASPTLRAAWYLRAAALAAVVAGAAGVIVAPGVRGNASEHVVELVERSSSVLAIFLAVVLAGLVVWGATELARAQHAGVASRVVLVVAGAAVVAASAPGLRDRLPPFLAMLLSAAAAVACMVSAWASARAPHTRAIAGVLLAFAFASVARLGAWELATAAGDRASVQLYSMSRGLATAGVLFEAFGQLVAVTWLGARSKLAGQVGSTLALVGAFVITYGVARGMHSGAALWQAVLHTALADAPGVPPPYGLDALATFLVPASLLLALVAAAQPKQVVALVATVALALVSRGAFDAPLRALCGVAAAQWALLACVDERAMWRTLIDDRQRRVDEA